MPSALRFFIIPRIAELSLFLGLYDNKTIPPQYHTTEGVLFLCFLFSITLYLLFLKKYANFVYENYTRKWATLYFLFIRVWI